MMAVEAAPTLLGRLRKLEDHGKCRSVRQAPLRAYGSMPHGGEGAFNGVAGPQVLPMLGREVVERQQGLAVLRQAVHRLVVLDRVNRGRYRVARPAQKPPLSIWLSVPVCSLRSRTRRAVARGPAALLDLRCAHRPSERQIGTAE